MAQDYGKNTVVQLKEIFKARGVPTTGLTRKAQLIGRLEELDGRDAGGVNGEGAKGDDVPGEPAKAMVEARAETRDLKKDEMMKGVEQTIEQPSPSQPPPDSRPLEADGRTPAAHSLTPNSETRKRKRRSVTPPLSATTTASKKPKPSENGAHVVQKGDVVSSVEGLPLAVEHADDVTVKKAEDKSTTEVTVQDDDRIEMDKSSEKLEEEQKEQPKEDVEMEEQKEDPDMKMDTTKPTESVSDSPIAPTRLPSAHTSRDDTLDPTTSPIAPTKLPIGREGRYKDLISETAPALDGTRDTSSQPAQSPSAEQERSVPAAIHPATAALYIRNLMRPLKDSALKSHLASLSHPPASTGSLPTGPREAITDAAVPTFHLDAVKTHCFAVFTSVAAASRVRNALHDAVWPPEGNRRTLWVDFVPEEKVEEWVAKEQQSGGRASVAKRWEVVYDSTAADGVVAELREAGLTPRDEGARAAPAAAPALSSAPATTFTKPHDIPHVHIPETSSSFVALDTLFRSTAAKPKLYYLPVSAARASARLDSLEAATTRRAEMADLVRRGGAGMWDSRRMSFEGGEVLVDGGPEFGMRGGGRGGRGGGGGFAARGGAGGGDSYVGGAGGYRGGGGGYGGWRGR